MRERKNLALGFLVLLVIYIFTESKGLIEPPQPHTPENVVYIPVFSSLDTVVGSATIGTTIWVA